MPSPDIPPELPVMVLQDCHLFPGCLLPLFIFEERYRKMLAAALASNRMFCIGNREGPSENSPVSDYSTAGLVRCCVKQEDGTSHLLLQGLKRIRITGWVQETPYRVARVQPVLTEPGDPEKIHQLKEHALSLFDTRGAAKALELHATLEQCADEEMVCDVLSYHLTRCPKLQQKLLGEPSLERRYGMLAEALEKMRCE